MSSPARRCIFRFGDFELDVSAYELRRGGRPIRLERQPMELLILLVERSRELVTREQIVARLWGDEIFVDVDTGVNTAIRKIRQALTVSAGCSPLVETVPGKGYRFVTKVTVALGQAGDGPTVMLAVLPFLNLSADTDRDYVADGLTEDMIATLSQVDAAHLRVIGRTSAMAYKGTKKSLATIGAELKAQFLVEGSIRSDGDVVRIHCTLNQVRDQTQLWAASCDRDMASLAAVPRELCMELADQIHLQMPPESMAAVSARQSTDAAAYDAYLRGRRFWNQLTPATTRKAVSTTRVRPKPTRVMPWPGLAWPKPLPRRRSTATPIRC